MQFVTRDSKIIDKPSSQDDLLKHIYGSVIGRTMLKIAVNPFISNIAGNFLSTRVSTLLIDSFIRSNHINMHDYIPTKYNSYNDFFTRKIKPEKRPIDNKNSNLISPSDGKVSVYEINEDSVFNVKNTMYTMDSILKNKKLAKEYINGYCVIIRLTVDDYHRYCNVDNGRIINNTKIQGVLHTVNPIANDYYKIYKENSREYTVVESNNFGQYIQMEVGALMVGKIVNNQTSGVIQKGTEKGRFEFGGSTIILFVKKDCVEIDRDLIINTKAGYETIVKMGEKIGESIKTK